MFPKNQKENVKKKYNNQKKKQEKKGWEFLTEFSFLFFNFILEWLFDLRIFQIMVPALNIYIANITNILTLDWTILMK